MSLGSLNRRKREREGRMYYVREGGKGQYTEETRERGKRGEGKDILKVAKSLGKTLKISFPSVYSYP